MSKVVRQAMVACLLCAFVATPLWARTITVHPGGSIRAALAQARSGDRVQVMPGIYREGSSGDLNALTIDQSDIELVGLSTERTPVVLESAGGQSFGIWVSPADSSGPGPEADPEHPPCGLAGTTVHGFALAGFTIRGFRLHGVHLACVHGFSLSRNLAEANGQYGLFPIVSRDGVISYNEVRGTKTDAAIYVGQSRNIEVVGNHVHDNLLGIEIENSLDSSVVWNKVHGNSFGIFVDLLPFLEHRQQSDALIATNEIYDNNRPNSADPDDVLAVLPQGIGILLSGADRTIVRDNAVTGNQYAGIGVASVCLGLALQGQPCDGLDIEPNPDGNRVVDNLVLGNGLIPLVDPRLNALRGDLVWDGTGVGNCWRDNRFARSAPSPLPNCQR